MSELTYTLEGSIAVVTMDDGKANALSKTMIASLVEALGRAEGEAKAMVLAGRPERFSGGFDLKMMMSGADAVRDLLGRGSALLMKLYGSKIPLVIACSGHAVAGGALLLLTGDWRIGAEGSFRIGLNEVTIGMPVPILAMELARDRLLPTELTRATLFSQMYAPADAAKAGYLDEVVPASELIARAKTEATRLSALAPAAFMASKARLRDKSIKHITATHDEDVRSLVTLMP